MIDRILPAAVHVSEARADRTDVELFPEEAAVVARAVDKRRHEFATVRACARDALQALGEPPAPLVPGLRGAPGWPDGIVGSMTHTAGYRGAAVARSTDLRSIGIDAEVDGPLPDGVLDAVSLPSERVMLAGLQTHVEHADRVLFSAKESVYKAWFPVTGRFLDFSEAELTLSLDGRFTARLRLNTPAESADWPEHLTGRWLVADGLVLSAVTLPLSSEGRPSSGVGRAAEVTTAAPPERLRVGPRATPVIGPRWPTRRGGENP